MNEYKFLNMIDSPDDLKKLPEDVLPEVCSEIRSFLIDSVQKTGGHLASNLGVVELSVALHKVFDSPNDHLIFDVGHQSYVHKILTGRKDRFSELRQVGGLSGFTKRSESEHDPFGAGHSSTSLSAAVGFAKTDKINKSNAYTIAVIGDGAYTGGMIHEALNNCDKDLNLIIVINENEMSISKNIGSFAKQIAKIRSRKKYYRIKDATRSVINHIPLIGKGLFKAVRNTKQSIKNLLYDSNFFEDLGLYYFGPVDGNDVHALIDIFEVAKDLNCCCVIHTTTVKGKGFYLAENNPASYHSIKPDSVPDCSDNFSLVSANHLVDMAGKYDDICAITAAMADGTCLNAFEKRFPKRFFDVGIAEEHAVTFAAGIASNNMVPFFAVYSSFLQRAYDNLIHDVALQNLNVNLLIDRAGLSVGDGPTHSGIFDVAYLSQLPNFDIYSPVTYNSLKAAMDLSYDSVTPSAVRYYNSGESDEINEKFFSHPDSYINDFIHCDKDSSDDSDCVIITYGMIVKEALRAKEEFEKKKVSCRIILLEKLTPYNDISNRIQAILPRGKAHIIFLEEGIKNGGASMILAEKMRNMKIMEKKKVSILAIENPFLFGEKGTSIYKSHGISSDDIVDAYFKY